MARPTNRASRNSASDAQQLSEANEDRPNDEQGDAAEDRPNGDRYEEAEVVVPGRSAFPHAPRVLECKNHPLTAHSSIVNRVLVMPVSTGRKDMEAAYKWEVKQKVPEGTKDDWIKQGWVELKAGDMVFVRDTSRQQTAKALGASGLGRKHGSRSVAGSTQLDGKYDGEAYTEVDEEVIAKDDVFAVGIGGWDHYSGDHGRMFRDAIANIVTEGEDGEIEFTRTGRQVQGNSCFQVGSTLQQVKKLVSPAAAGKGAGPFTAYQRQVNELVMATSAMAADVMKNFPQPLQQALKANHEVLNFPTVGVAGNYMFPQVQVNVSTVGGKTGGLEQLGPQFGGPHIDHRDHHAYPAFLIAHPVLPRGWHPGYYFVPSLGVFGELHAGVCVCFHGKRLHCFKEPHRLPNVEKAVQHRRPSVIDQPQRPPRKNKIEKRLAATKKPDKLKSPPNVETGYRVNTVLFTSKSTVDGKAVFALASKPCKEGKKKGGKGKGKGKEASDDKAEETEGDDDADDEGESKGEGVGDASLESKEPFLITPEMVNACDNNFVPPTSTLATYASDGAVIMDADTQMNYVGRSILQHATYIFRQMRESLKINIDAKQFLGSITYTDDFGNIKSLSEWECAPGVNTSSKTRQAARTKFTEYEREVQKFIPSTARKLTEAKTANLQAKSTTNGDPTAKRARRSGRLARVKDIAAGLSVEERGAESSNTQPAPSIPQGQQRGEKASIVVTAGQKQARARERARRMWGTDMEVVEETEQEECSQPATASNTGVGMGSVVPVYAQQVDVEETTDCEGSLEVNLSMMESDGRTHDGEDRGIEGSENGRHEDGGDGMDMDEENIGVGGSDEEVIEADGNNGEADEDMYDASERGEKRTNDESTLTIQPGAKRLKVSTYEDYAFLVALSTDELTSELRRVTTGKIAWMREFHKAPGLGAGPEWLRIRALSQELVSSPISESSPSIAKDIRRQAIMADAAFKGTEYVYRLTRLRVMMAETWAWNWVDGQLVDIMLMRWDEPESLDRRKDWLDDMLSIATNALFFGHKMIEFNPHIYTRLTAISPYPFTIRNWNSKKFSKAEDGYQYRDAVVEVVREAVAEWSGITSDVTRNDKINRLRAQFINTVRTSLGESFLTTDIVWRTFTDFKSHQFIFDSKTRYSRLIPLDAISPFKSALLAHPILQDGSEERMLYLQYCKQAPDESMFT